MMMLILMRMTLTLSCELVFRIVLIATYFLYPFAAALDARAEYLAMVQMKVTSFEFGPAIHIHTQFGWRQIQSVVKVII